MNSKPLIAVLILAAGESSRLGRAKQLEKFQGKTLLQRIIDEVDKLQVPERFVVLGSGAAAIEKQVDLKQVKTVLADDWKSGMSASLKAGLLSIDEPNIDAVLIVLADQPFVDAVLLEKMITEFEQSGKGIVACKYGNVTGVPVLFSKEYFKDLLAVSGDHGAQPIIRQNSDDCSTVAFEQGAVDIDTEADFERLTEN